jgi:hypothetical protein
VVAATLELQSSGFIDDNNEMDVAAEMLHKMTRNHRNSHNAIERDRGVLGAVRSRSDSRDFTREMARFVLPTINMFSIFLMAQLQRLQRILNGIFVEFGDEFYNDYPKYGTMFGSDTMKLTGGSTSFKQSTIFQS